MAEHILHDRPDDVAGGVTLVPSSGGVFEVTYNDALIYSKKAEGRFPEHAEIGEQMDSQTLNGEG